MKEILYRYRLPIIIVAVMLVLVIAGLVIRMLGGGDGGEGYSEFFTESMYPASCEEQKDGSIRITVDGSATKELSWKVKNETKSLWKMDTKKKEKKGVLTVTFIPKDTGYASVRFTRKKKISGIKVTVASIHVECVISMSDEGTLITSVSDIYQDAASYGASDSDTPYIIDGQRIRLPGGGDWVLTEVTAGSYDMTVADTAEEAETSEDSGDIILPEALKEEMAAAKAEGETETVRKEMDEIPVMEGSKVIPEEEVKEENAKAAKQKTKSGKTAKQEKEDGKAVKQKTKAGKAATSRTEDTAADAIFDIYTGTDDEGVAYIDSFPRYDVDEAVLTQVRFELKSDSLGVTQTLKYRVDENGEGRLEPAKD